MNVSSECHNAMNICAVLLFWSNIENSISFCSSFCKRRDDFSSVAVPSKTEKGPLREVQMQLDKLWEWKKVAILQMTTGPPLGKVPASIRSGEYRHFHKAL